jgi:hypothetical protein
MAKSGSNFFETSRSPSRRLFINMMAATATTAAAPIAQAGTSEDTEIMQMAGQIVALRAEADAIDAERVWPFDEEYDRTLGDVITPESLDAAFAFSKKVGREAGIMASNKVVNRADALMRRMWTIPAKTEAGRQAKVRTLFIHCLSLDEKWLASDHDADWDVEVTRQLLCEFSGMSVEELLA